MGWEKRGNGRYYYRKRRVNGRPVSEYVGNGRLADFSAALDAHRDASRAAWRKTVEDTLATERALNRLEGVLRTMVSSVLVANGYHAHKRQWRKRRRSIRQGKRDHG